MSVYKRSIAVFAGLFVLAVSSSVHGFVCAEDPAHPGVQDCGMICPSVADCDEPCLDANNSCALSDCIAYGDCPAQACLTDGTGCTSNCTTTPGFACGSNCNDEDNVCSPSACGLKVGDAYECDLNDGWYDVGSEYVCSQSGTDICDCQNQEYRNFTCDPGSPADCIVDAVTSTQILYSNCMTCDDGNVCTDDGVNASETACEFTNNSYSQPCYTGPAGTEGVGVCQAGTETCSGGMMGACIGEVTPTAEVCDAFKDENCDGTVDEGCACTDGDVVFCYSGDPLTRGVGECSDGTQSCTGGVWGPCTGEILPTGEVCDNLDNDCDGTIDGIIDPNCYTGPAGTEGVGECTAGARGCSAGVWGACMSEVTPAPEICGDGLDNDCDGVVDNDCPLCVPETCNGEDDDCDGEIDEADASNDCPAGEVCAYGTCFVDCSTTMTCAGTDTCLTDDFRCDDASDPCGSISCTAGDLCYRGSCFPDCSMSDICDPLNETCYQSGRCVTNDDPCLDVQCPIDQLCYGGSCFDPCSETQPCTAPLICFDGRCAADACDGIDCPVGQNCVGGGCFDVCTVDSQCDPAICAGTQDPGEERCTADPCFDRDCPLGQVCHNGNCYDECLGAANCPGDPCWEDEVNGNYCAADPCDGHQCGTEQVCVGGNCFDTCMGDPDCDPDSICYDNRCVDKDDPKCDGQLCQVGQVCFQGDCFEDCSSTDPCADPSSICYQGACVPDSCPAGCDPGEVCHRGVCFVDCSMTGICEEPLECYDGRCAASMCEAIDPPELLTYNTNHPFRQKGKRIRAYQRTTPWTYFRPFVNGTDYEDFMALSGDSSTHPLHEPRRAKAVLHLEGNDYVLWLTHGATSGQGAAEATYSVRIDGENPDVLLTDDPGAEAYKLTSNNPRHIQTFITTGANETGGVAIGKLPADQDWTIKLFASFHGDIEGWDLVNGETGESVPIQPRQPLIIKSENMPAGDTFSPKIGGACDTGLDGVCQAGTYVTCELYETFCQPTVYGAAIEICDGVDNTCNGLVDAADSSLRVPMIEAKQAGLGGFTTWPTYDAPEGMSERLSYTPDGSDDRIGSTVVTLPDGSTVQDNPFQSHAIPYRDLRDGQIHFIFVHGKPGVSSSGFDDDEEGDHVFEFDLDAPGTISGSLNHMFISWYDDRKPGSTDDRIPKEYFNDEEELDLEWELPENRSGGGTESDAFVMGIDWFGDLMGFRIDWSLESDDEDDNPFDWLLHAPTVGAVELRIGPKLDVRIEPKRLSESTCFAGSPTMAGCSLSTYACVGGQLECQAPSDPACNNCVDEDGDTYFRYDAATCPMGDDCNDDDPKVHPGAPERCNGVDDDCDGVVDQTNTGCPQGAPCGPLICNYNISCICPDGPMIPEEPGNECYCGAGLNE